MTLSHWNLEGMDVQGPCHIPLDRWWSTPHWYSILVLNQPDIQSFVQWIDRSIVRSFDSAFFNGSCDDVDAINLVRKLSTSELSSRFFSILIFKFFNYLIFTHNKFFSKNWYIRNISCFNYVINVTIKIFFVC